MLVVDANGGKYKMTNQRPSCQVLNCNGDGLLMFGGIIVCGKCMSKFHFQEQEKLKEQIININKGDE